MVESFVEAQVADRLEATSHEFASRVAADALAMGREHGSRQGALRMVKRAISRVFGMPDPELNQRLEQLPSEHLEALIVNLFDMTTPDDLTIWLDRKSCTG